VTRAGTSRRSPAKRRTILDAATSVFLEQGYARASVDAIAAAAGVGKQTVYSHFGNKEQLFLAVVSDARTTEEEIVAASPVVTGDPRTDLAEVARRILDVALALRVAALHRLTIAELPHHPELQRMWRDDADRPGTDTTLVAYLRECTRDGRLEVPDPELAARQLSLLAVTEGRVATLHGTQPLSADDRERIARETSDLIVRAYRA
jgi:TetR/AcrR family transcriptional regulator, mexJK operon transcriptional repressor